MGLRLRSHSNMDLGLVFGFDWDSFLCWAFNMGSWFFGYLCGGLSFVRRMNLCGIYLVGHTIGYIDGRFLSV